MANGFLSVRDNELLAWAERFSAGISLDPEALGLTAADAAAFVGQYHEFQAAIQRNLPAVRSKVTTIHKNDVRSALVAEAKLLVNRVNGQPGVTDAQKTELGLVVRTRPMKATVPQEPPSVMVSNVSGHQVTITLSALYGSKRTAGAFAATVLSYIGDEPPADPYAWNFCGNFGRNRIDLIFPDTLAPGTKVWISAEWMNTRLEPGPRAVGVCTYLQGGSFSTQTLTRRNTRPLARAA